MCEFQRGLVLSEESLARFDELWSDAALRRLTSKSRGKDHVEVVIDVHLRLEQTLIQILSIRLAHPEQLEVDKLDFYTKVNVAAACGLINDRKALHYINGIRNKLAHRLSFVVTNDIAAHLEKLAYGRPSDSD